MTDETPGSDGQPVRRRLQSTEQADTKGRGGCLLTGAILGIIFGLTFAFYGLPPILRHYYGAEEVAAGGTYASGNRSMNVTSSGANGDGGAVTVIVRVHSSGFEVGEPRPGRYRLEVEGIDEWITPSPRSGPAETFAPLPPGEQEIQLIFEIAGRNDPATVRAIALHLEDPRVEFALEP